LGKVAADTTLFRKRQVEGVCKLIKVNIKGKERPVCVVATNKEIPANLVNSKTMSSENDKVGLGGTVYKFEEFN
jgi:hypothetical protein